MYIKYNSYRCPRSDRNGQTQGVANLDKAGRPGLACVALHGDERDGVAGSAAGTGIRSLFNRAFMLLISSNFAAIVTAYASAIAALLSFCASAIEADAAVLLVAFNPAIRKYLDGMLLGGPFFVDFRAK